MRRRNKWSVKDIRGLFDELDKITGANSSNIDIIVNPKLKKAVARYTCYSTSRRPVKFDFSEAIMNVPNKKALYDVAIHEYAHYIVNTYRKSNNIGHSAEFRQVCKELGTDNYQSTCTHFISNQLSMAMNKITMKSIEEEIKNFEKALEEMTKKEPTQCKKNEKMIGQYDKKGNLIRKDTEENFAKEFKITNIIKCCEGQYKTSQGYSWKYIER